MPAPARPAAPAPMLTMRPPPAAMKYGRAAFDATTAVFRFIANMSSQVETSPFSSVSQRNPPATLTNTWKPSVAAATDLTAAFAASGTVRSTPPRSTCRAPNSCAAQPGTASRPSNPRRMPRPAKRRATAAPRAPKAPVMTTVEGSDTRPPEWLEDLDDIEGGRAGAGRDRTSGAPFDPERIELTERELRPFAADDEVVKGHQQRRVRAQLEHWRLARGLASQPRAAAGASRHDVEVGHGCAERLGMDRHLARKSDRVALRCERDCGTTVDGE